MNTNIQGDFQMYISVPLITQYSQENNTFKENLNIRKKCE